MAEITATRFDIEAVALSLMLICPSGCEAAKRGVLLSEGAWEWACLVASRDPLEWRNLASAGALSALVGATAGLINARPTGREMQLLEATIRRLKSP